ncbi:MULTISPECIES: helix-turn-helix domain-containing protein [Acutalibacter]|uniref:helix-turn-helix domain-containing protein n=1 Tax=Acutalibacter TaxID=1918385 RepID=UPI002AC96F1D|nr:helix-turn-helix domain-containing protein [Acutalibacter sp. M00118]
MPNSIFANYPDIVSVEDVQAMLHIGRNAAYGLLQSGAITTIRVGKKYIIPKASVIDFLGLNKAAKPDIMNPSGKSACKPRKE